MTLAQVDVDSIISSLQSRNGRHVAVFAGILLTKNAEHWLAERYSLRQYMSEHYGYVRFFVIDNDAPITELISA